MPPTPDPPDWTARGRDALAAYAGPLLRAVAARLVKPRTNQPVDELLDKSAATLTNPPVIDRRIKARGFANRSDFVHQAVNRAAQRHARPDHAHRAA